jgi:hypothetical protein
MALPGSLFQLERTMIPDIIKLQEVRAHFAAHAPPVPDWFNPVVPPPPRRPDVHVCPNCRDDTGPCLSHAGCIELRKFQKQREDWQDMRRRECLFQWPVAWADEMIKRMGL